MGMGMGMAAGVSTTSVGLGMFLLVEAMEEKEGDMGGAWDLVVGDILIGALVEEDILWELFKVVKQVLVAPMAEVQAGRFLEEALVEVPLVNKGQDRVWGRLVLAEASRKSVSTPTCWGQYKYKLTPSSRECGQMRKSRSRLSTTNLHHSSIRWVPVLFFTCYLEGENIRSAALPVWGIGTPLHCIFSPQKSQRWLDSLAPVWSF